MATQVLPIAEADICIFQGATFNQTLYYEVNGANVDLSDYDANMQIRSSPSSKAIILELSNTNGRITLNDQGAINLLISATDTSYLSACNNAVYDLQLTNDLIVTRILQGNVIISPEVTK